MRRTATAVAHQIAMIIGSAFRKLLMACSIEDCCKGSVLLITRGLSAGVIHWEDVEFQYWNQMMALILPPDTPRIMAVTLRIRFSPELRLSGRPGTL